MDQRVVLRRNRAFVLLAVANGIRGMAFWLSWLGMLSLASFTFKASAGQIALITAATSIPHILFSPFTGTLVDRTNPKWTLVGTFAANIGIACALLFINSVWQTYLIAFAWSTAGAIVWPSLGSMLKGLVPDRELARANGALNSVWEVTLIVGPLLSGVLASQVSPRAPFAVGAALYGLGTLVLLPMRFTHVKAVAPPKGSRIAELRQGLDLMLGRPDLRALALWGAIAWGGFNVLIAVEPVFIRESLGGGESMLGAMYSVGGIGSTIGAVAIGWFAVTRKELRIASVGLAMVGAFFGLYVAVARWPHVLPLQAFIGGGFAIYQTLTQSLVQRVSPRTVVGRALAAKRGIEETAGLGGSLLAGAVASAAGARPTMVAAGAVMTFAALALLRSAMRLHEPEDTVEPDDEEQEPSDLPFTPLPLYHPEPAADTG